MTRQSPISFTYKTVDSHDLELDVYLPAQNGAAATSSTKLPTLIWFHGGGGFGGNKRPKGGSMVFPLWAIDMATVRNGWIFISANYRLLLPSTANHILEDTKDVFRFASERLAVSIDSSGFTVDAEKLLVGGDSFGGCCARLAAIHAILRPKAVFLLYGMGGNYLTPFWLGGRSATTAYKMPGDSELTELPDPVVETLLQSTELCDSTEMGSNPDGTPLHARGRLFPYSVQTGSYLDIYCGVEGLSQKLREAIETDAADERGSMVDAALAIIPKDVKHLIPQGNIDANFPPTILVHGTADTSVPLAESQYTAAQLEKLGVENMFITIEGGEHYCDAGAKAIDEDPFFSVLVENGVERWLNEKLNRRA